MAIYAVIGAGGATGKILVEALLAEGHTVRAVVRTPAKYEGKWDTAGKSGTLEIVSGDVTSAESMVAALTGVDGVAFVAATPTWTGAGGVDRDGVKHTIEALKQAGNGGAKFVLMSAAGVSPKNRYKPPGWILSLIRWRLPYYKYAGEQFLRASGNPYVIVRPGILKDFSGTQDELRFTQTDPMAGGYTTRNDVVAVIVNALGNASLKKTTLEVFNKAVKEGAAPAKEQVASLVSGLKDDA